MASRNQRNTFLTGLFVSAAIVASVVIIVILSGVLDTMGTRVYTVRFDLGTNIGGLTAGAEVRVGGRRVGVVNAVEFAEEDGAISGIDVAIRVDKDVRIAEDAFVTLELPLLGTQGVINFPDLGEGPRLAEGGTLDGQLAPPGFLAQAGFGEEERTRVQAIIENVNQFSGRLGTMGDSAQATVDEAKAIIADVRTNWENNWRARVDSIMGNVDTTAARGPELAADLDTRIDEVGDLLATAKSYLDDNRDSVDEIIENTRGISRDGKTFTERLNGEITDKFMQLLETGRTELTKAGDAVEKYGTILDEQRPNIRKSLANFRLASDQLRDTLVEVRRSPWRLIYRPDTRELQYELLYDAARTYAAALSDLRAATEAIEELKVANPSDTERYEELMNQLDNAFDGYREAETLFIERIGEEAKNVGADE
ncbi:MAG: hypothetical protein Tsb0013_12380 [Phycisphaerales bacterium]